jgi:hypothetical protein
MLQGSLLKATRTGTKIRKIKGGRKRIHEGSQEYHSLSEKERKSREAQESARSINEW